MSKTIYIVLTETGSWLSRAIQLYTQENFNHVSIAFDSELKEMYSFGRKFENNPFIGGFVKEDVRSRLFRNANCAIYQCTVSDEQYAQLQEEIQYFELNKDKYKYNFIGLIGVACRIKLKRSSAFFCSQFIATLFMRAGLSINDQCPYFTKPTDFTKWGWMQLCYQGQLRHYVFLPRTSPMPNIPIRSIGKIA